MGVKEQQLGFSDWERSRVRKQTRKEEFLCESVMFNTGGEGWWIPEPQA